MNRLKIFISSVQKEFAEERQALASYIRSDALLGMFFEPFLFENFPANDKKPKQIYLEEVKHSDVYLGIYGTQYGFEDSEGISPTEREYDTAVSLGISRLIFIKKVEHREAKEATFIHKVEQELTRRSFQTADELRNAVYAALVRFLTEKEFIHFQPFDISHDTDATIEDLDEDRIKNFIHMARAKRNFPLAENTKPTTLLKHLDLVDESEQLTNAAILLFGKKPQKYFISSEVKCAQFYGTRTEKPMLSYQIFKGDVFQLVDDATSFVMSHVDNWTGTRATGETASIDTHPELPMDAVKEAIVNAVCHRDYNSNGSVQVMLYKDRLEIWNPGKLPSELTAEDLKETHRSIPANPMLAEPMYLSGYIEKLGTGTEDIIKKCTDYGLKTPEFHIANDFKVIIWRASQNDAGLTTSTAPDKHPTSTRQVPDKQTTKNPNIFALVEVIGEQNLSVKEMMTSLELKNRENFLNLYLSPAIKEGVVRMLYPNSPKHPRQKYLLTEIGLAIYQNLDKK